MKGKTTRIRIGTALLAGCIGILRAGNAMPFNTPPSMSPDSMCCAGKQPAWVTLPEIAPDESGYAAGVSAMYAGATGDVLIAAGGANFPAIPAAEGGKKVFYDGIYLLRDGAWSRVGTLPAPAAYGVCFPLADGLVLVGGANASGALRSVIRLCAKKDEVILCELPALPHAVEQAAGAAIDGILYIAGGLSDGKPSPALLALDTKTVEPQWRTLAPLPEAFVQPVMAASAGRLYLWGGFDPEKGTVSAKGYRYDPATDIWCEIPGLPDGGTLTGGCAATLADGRIACAGGVDRAIFSAALRLPAEKLRDYLSQPPAAYRFRRELWIFDVETERWSLVGASDRTARAGATLVPFDGGLCLLGGEIKPGIRTPDVCRTDNLK